MTVPKIHKQQLRKKRRRKRKRNKKKNVVNAVVFEVRFSKKKHKQTLFKNMNFHSHTPTIEIAPETPHPGDITFGAKCCSRVILKS